MKQFLTNSKWLDSDVNKLTGIILTCGSYNTWPTDLRDAWLLCKLLTCWLTWSNNACLTELDMYSVVCHLKMAFLISILYNIHTDCNSDILKVLHETETIVSKIWRKISDLRENLHCTQLTTFQLLVGQVTVSYGCSEQFTAKWFHYIGAWILHCTCTCTCTGKNHEKSLLYLGLK